MALKENTRTGASDYDTNNEVEYREFTVISDGEFTFSYADQAKFHPGLPRIGDVHPRFPNLRAKYIASEPDKDSRGTSLVVYIRITYASPRGTLLLPDTMIKYHFRGSVTSQFVEVGLNGVKIGTPYLKYFTVDSPNRPEWRRDPNAKMGTNVFIGAPTLIAQFPVPYRLVTPANIINALATTNSDSFPNNRSWFFPRGTVQLMGFDAEEIGPEIGDYRLSLLFRLGLARVYDPVAQAVVVVPLDKTFWYEYEVRESLIGGPGSEPIVTQIPKRLHIEPIQTEFNYNTLLI